PEVMQSLVVTTELGEGDAAIAMGGGGIGTERDRAVETGQRVGGTAEVIEDDTAVEMKRRGVGRAGHGPIHGFERLMATAEGEQDNGAQAERVGAVGIDRQRGVDAA